MGGETRTRRVHEQTKVWLRKGQSVSQSVSYFTVPPRAHPSSANFLLSRGGDVSARAHTCVAWGRCVAFGPSEDERLGTRWCR